MKILVPYYLLDDFTIDNKIVVGGIEMFIRKLYNNLEGVIIIPITKKERKQRLVTKKLISAIEDHDIDIVIANYNTSVMTTTLMKQVNVPVLWINHMAALGISILSTLQTMVSFMNCGGYLCMVSEWQYNKLNGVYKRLNNGSNFPPINGKFINATFCNGDERCYEPEYDVATIGRIDPEKDPFFIHRKGKNILHTKVFTTLIDDNTYRAKVDYEAKNQHWRFPQETIYNMTHDDVMYNMSKAYVYNSTCDGETWGITCLEALSHGLPVLLNTNNNSHASETIPARKDHIKLISKKITSEEYIDLVNKFKKEYSFDRRLEISNLTKEKHSKEKWVNSLYDILESTIANHKKHQNINSLERFFE